MTPAHCTPTGAELKAQAKSLRTALSATGHDVSHGQALELLARQMGARDWNTLAARASDESGAQSPRYHLGQRLSGRYLGQRFKGRVIALGALSGGRHLRLTVQFDAPVNVGRFDTLPVTRRRVTAVVDRNGMTAEKTSDGRPHLVLDRPNMLAH